MIRRSRRWLALLDQVQRLWQESPRAKRARRVRLTWQTCRRCHRSSLVTASHNRLCGGCRSLR
jgi:hypothetical protein